MSTILEVLKVTCESSTGAVLQGPGRATEHCLSPPRESLPEKDVQLGPGLLNERPARLRRRCLWRPDDLHVHVVEIRVVQVSPMATDHPLWHPCHADGLPSGMTWEKASISMKRLDSSAAISSLWSGTCRTLMSGLPNSRMPPVCTQSRPDPGESSSAL